MSTDTSTNPPAGGSSETPEGTPTGGSGFEPITSQDQLNRIIGERVTRERARFADYSTLKQQVEKVPELESQVAAAQAEVAAVPTKVAAELRAHLIALHGIDQRRADLFLTASDPATLLEQARELVVVSGAPQGLHVFREGTTTPRPGNDELRTFTRGLFDRAQAD
jgi:hypothetical protein